jgi:ferric-dicitrate binding protein FerR (iron transport regulator)
MNENEHIIAIIAKQLQGLATEQEAAELQLWLQQDASHQSAYNELVVIWQRSANVLSGSEPRFNAEVAWLQLDKKIAVARRKTTPELYNFLKFTRTAEKVAAVLIITAAIAGGYWWYRHSQWQTFTASTNNQQVTLADNSVVILRKGSSISYPRTFNKKQRLVKLTGEAFFQVHHNDQQPFIINTPLSEVQVVGTSFMVNARETSDEVVVVTGKVHVADKKQTGNEVLLTPGQRVVLQQDHFYQNQVTDSNFIAWKTGLLNFKNASVQKVLQDLSDYYGIQAELDTTAARDTAALTITVRFDNQPLEQALDEIRLITGLEMKKEADKVIFYRK